MSQKPTESQILLTFEGRNLIPPCYLKVFLKSDFSPEEYLGRTENSNTKIHSYFKTFRIGYSFECFQQIRLQLVLIPDKNLFCREESPLLNNGGSSIYKDKDNPSNFRPFSLIYKEIPSAIFKQNDSVFKNNNILLKDNPSILKINEGNFKDIHSIKKDIRNNENLSVYKENEDIQHYQRTVLLSRILRTHQQKMDLRFVTNFKLSKANQPLITIQAENKGMQSGEVCFYLMGKFSYISYFVPSIYYTVSDVTHPLVLEAHHHNHHNIINSYSTDNINNNNNNNNINNNNSSNNNHKINNSNNDSKNDINSNNNININTDDNINNNNGIDNSKITMLTSNNTNISNINNNTNPNNACINNNKLDSNSIPHNYPEIPSIKTKSEILSGYELIWPEYNLSLSHISGERDLERSLKVSFFMKNWIFSDTLLGEVHLNILDIMESNKRKYPILYEKKKLVGNLFLSRAKYHWKPSFLDYLFTGLDINLIIACDFPLETTNDPILSYESIFEALQSFINEYDSDKKAFLFGYGPKFLEINDYKFSLEGFLDKQGILGSTNPLENLIQTYKEVRNQIAKRKEVFNWEIEQSSSTKNKRRQTLKKENHFKLDNLKDEEQEVQRLLFPFEVDLPKDVNIKQTRPTKPIGIKLSNSLSLKGEFKSSTLGTRQKNIVKSSQNLEDLLIEISETLKVEFGKPKQSRLKHYILVVLIDEEPDYDDLQKAFDICNRLSGELPFSAKFLIKNSNYYYYFKNKGSLLFLVYRKIN